MKTYVRKSIQYNRKRYALLSLVSVIGFSFIFMMMQFLSTMVTDRVNADFKDMFSILIVFCVVIISSVVGMLTTVYKLLYQSRRSEIENLRYIGCSRTTIRNLFLREILMLGTAISILSLLLGIMITALFNHLYKSPIRMTLVSIAGYPVIGIALFCITVNRQLANCLNRVFECKLRERKGEGKGERKRARKRVAYSSRKAYRTLLFCLVLWLGYMLFRSSVADIADIVYDMDIWVIDEMLIAGIAILCIKPIIFFLLLLANHIVTKLKLANLTIALRHILYDMPRTLWLVGNLIFSISLLLFFLVMFYSIPQSTLKHMDENTLYNHVYLDEDFSNQPVFEKKMDIVIASSLEVIGHSDTGKEFLIKGVDDAYNEVERVEVFKGRRQFYTKGSNEMSAVISGLDARNNNWAIADRITMLVNGRKLNLQISGINDSFVYGEIFVDRSSLSERLYGNQYFANTWYTKDEIHSADLHSRSLEHRTKEEIIHEAKEAVLGGTEIIVTILYVYVISSFCMLLNIFVISLDERKHSNTVMRDMGIMPKRIQRIQFIEISITILTGVVIGMVIGYCTILSLPGVVELLYGFKISLYIPASIYIILTGVSILAVLCIRILSKHATQSNHIALRIERG